MLSRVSNTLRDHRPTVDVAASNVGVVYDGGIELLCTLIGGNKAGRRGVINLESRARCFV